RAAGVDRSGAVQQHVPDGARARHRGLHLRDGSPPDTLPLKRFAVAIVGALCVLGPRASQAAGSLEVTGSQTSANALAARIFARGAEAAYYNPALLPEAEPVTLVGVFTLVNHESIRLDARPAGVDVPSSVYRARIGGADGTTSRLRLRPLPTSDL